MQAIVPTRRISGFEHSIDFVRKLFLGAFGLGWRVQFIFFRFPAAASPIFRFLSRTAQRSFPLRHRTF